MELLEKLSDYKPLAKIQEVEEQNYNMIDNVLNNGFEKAQREAEKKEHVGGNGKKIENQDNSRKEQREI